MHRAFPFARPPAAAVLEWEKDETPEQREERKKKKENVEDYGISELAKYLKEQGYKPPMKGIREMIKNDGEMGNWHSESEPEFEEDVEEEVVLPESDGEM